MRLQEICVFGSYGAGALRPGDIDLVIRHSDPSGEIGREQLTRMLDGRASTTPFEQALRGKHRGFNIFFNERNELERQDGFALILLWERGDSLETALHRLLAIPADPAAGSAPRDFTHPAIAGFEKRVPIATRERLIELDQSGAIMLRRFAIDRDLEPRDEKLRLCAGSGYADTSPRRRSTRALLASLERDGIPVEDSHRNVILTYDLRHGPFAMVHYGAEHLNTALDHALYHQARRSYCVPQSHRS